MIIAGKSFNYDDKKWIITNIVSVNYVSYIGYVVQVIASEADSDKPIIDNRVSFDLIANGTPLGYSHA